MQRFQTRMRWISSVSIWVSWLSLRWQTSATDLPPTLTANKYIKLILLAALLVATQPEKKSPAGKIENLTNGSSGRGLKIDGKSTRSMLSLIQLWSAINRHFAWKYRNNHGTIVVTTFRWGLNLWRRETRGRLTLRMNNAYGYQNTQPFLVCYEQSPIHKFV